MHRNDYISALDIARVYVGLKENDLAFEWLEKACEERNGEVVFLNAIGNATSIGGLWADMHKDPRFPALLRLAGLTA